MGRKPFLRGPRKWNVTDVHEMALNLVKEQLITFLIYLVSAAGRLDTDRLHANTSTLEL